MTEDEVTRQCPSCEQEHPLRSYEHSDGSTEDVCFPCRVGSIFIGKPRDFATRTWSKAPPAKPGNSWEAGTPVDERGMPYLIGENMHDVQAKEFVEKRHLIEETERARHAVPPPDWARK